MMLAVFLIQYASTCVMTGIIWIVQVVHYPLFRKVGIEYFKNYEAGHTKLIAFIVIPTMLVELVTTIYILFSNLLKGTEFVLYLVASIILLVIWLSTIFIQARQHNRLSWGYDIVLINRLVSYNWIRTIGWTFRTLLLSLIFQNLINI